MCAAGACAAAPGEEGARRTTTPGSTLARFDQDTLRGLHRTELNIAELVAENQRGTSNFQGQIFAAEEQIASTALAVYCDEITRAWPDADTVTFTLRDGHDGPMLQVFIEDVDGAEVEMGNEAQDLFDHIEYQDVKRFDAVSIDMRQAAVWQPGDEPLGR